MRKLQAKREELKAEDELQHEVTKINRNITAFQQSFHKTAEEKLEQKQKLDREHELYEVAQEMFATRQRLKDEGRFEDTKRITRMIKKQLQKTELIKLFRTSRKNYGLTLKRQNRIRC